MCQYFQFLVFNQKCTKAKFYKTFKCSYMLYPPQKLMQEEMKLNLDLSIAMQNLQMIIRIVASGQGYAMLLQRGPEFNSRPYAGHLTTASNQLQEDSTSRRSNSGLGRYLYSSVPTHIHKQFLKLNTGVGERAQQLKRTGYSSKGNPASICMASQNHP